MKKRCFRISMLILTLVMSLSLTAFAAEPGTEFKDVKETDYFYPAVQWGLEAGITNGVGGNRFDPSGKVTRAQAVTFLWRMAGTPAPTKTETFKDVKAGSWYETAVQWAVEEGITKGTGGNKFSPDKTLDRAMCLTLLYRMEGSPLDEAAAMDPVELTEDMSLEDLAVYMIQQMIEMFRSPEIFPDVVQESYYELAVVWGGILEILTDDNTGPLEEGVGFRPHDPCVRSEMISFLYQTKLMEDEADGPFLYELDTITLAVPQEYDDLLALDFYELDEGEEGVLVVVAEAASREAAEAMGRDPEETGAGELFRVERVGQKRLNEILEEELSGVEVFAKDEAGSYYVFVTPTDVRFERETPEQMGADAEQWADLNRWAREEAMADILEYSEGLTEYNN